ncbi:putative metallopeptidase [Comamonadaceae bacterium PP-2]
MGRKAAVRDARPMPPPHLTTEEGDQLYTILAPAPDLRDWVIRTFISDDGSLHNPDHRHLALADLEFLWASNAFAKQGRTVVGQAEEVMFRAGGWQKERQEQQMREWFDRIPKYLITIAADYSLKCGDVEFCALIEHELYHIAHKTDEFGAPAFTKEGIPKMGLQGHDVEEFLGVVKRYGVGDPNGALAKLASLARGAPSVSRVDVAGACGTCLLRVA